MYEGQAELMEPTDKQLLDQYRNGQTDALQALVQKYRRQLYGFILNMTEGSADADEVFQEVWFRAIRHLGTYKQGNFLGWLVRIARNLVIDKARRRKPVVSLDQEDEDGRSMKEALAGDDPGPRVKLEASDIGQKIAAAAATLPDDQKEVFLLRVQADLPFKEIAKIQKVSINTALARMQYALAKLRVLLQDDYDVLTGQP